MQKKTPIPVYHLQERASKFFELMLLSGHQDIAHWNQAHRDDNFLLIFQQSGLIELMVDFKKVEITGAAIYAILPGQVHYGIAVHMSSAWAIAIDPALIKENYRRIFTSFATTNKAVNLTPAQAQLSHDSLMLFEKMNQQFADDSDDQALHAMLEVCICLFVAACRPDKSYVAQSDLRPVLITTQFRSLLLLSFREMKNPSEYAAALNISPSYLNEVVKVTTGYPVSYWIHQEIIMEAKRMLFYTSSTVKEISHLLGYTDTPYFIRLFGKITGMSPLQFRSNYRK